MNRGGPQWQDPRNRALIEATYGVTVKSTIEVNGAHRRVHCPEAFPT